VFLPGPRTRLLNRTPQLETPFVVGKPSLGFYNDLRPHLFAHVAQPRDGAVVLGRLTADRTTANPVTIAQIGLGAWQASVDDGGWLATVKVAADWLRGELEAGAGIPYLFPLRHTYRLDPPWLSAMAQGEVASLLVRAADTFGEPAFLQLAGEAIRPLLGDGEQLVVETEDGPVLQEYPTTPPAHVLNGWIFALWGLYDVAKSPLQRQEAEAAFESGVATLGARVGHYDIGNRWSRYDLFPHPLPNVASPFYHRLHVEQLAALNRLAPNDSIARTEARWRKGMSSRPAQATAVVAKVAFRAVRPRRFGRGAT
jgi:heparosan-N-sulfate-glucuronate 5-epimerase